MTRQTILPLTSVMGDHQDQPVVWPIILSLEFHTSPNHGSKMVTTQLGYLCFRPSLLKNSYCTFVVANAAGISDRY